MSRANLNMRSMAADSEINIAVDNGPFARDARQKVWSNLAGSDLNGGGGGTKTVSVTHEDWQKRMEKNAQDRAIEGRAQGPQNGSFIHTYEDPRDAPAVKLAWPFMCRFFRLPHPGLRVRRPVLPAHNANRMGVMKPEHFTWQLLGFANPLDNTGHADVRAPSMDVPAFGDAWRG